MAAALTPCARITAAGGELTLQGSSASASSKTAKHVSRLACIHGGVHSLSQKSVFLASMPLLQAQNRKQACNSVKAEGRLVTAKAAEGDLYEVELEKPYGIKFYKGEDLATYVDLIAPGSSADRVGLISEGDKVLATSAIFGDDIWPAAEYGRTMYSVTNRVGILTLKMQKMNGVKTPIFEGNEQWKQERNAGNYGDAIRDKQIENYTKKVEMQAQREKELAEGLKEYKAGNYEESLIRFETVIALEPTRKEQAVASYNIACCYSKLGQVDAGLAALEAAMVAGFEDYKNIRTDADLTKLRESEKFVPLLNRFDEPFINENALKAISSVFGIFGGKK